MPLTKRPRITKQVERSENTVITKMIKETEEKENQEVKRKDVQLALERMMIQLEKRYQRFLK